MVHKLSMMSFLKKMASRTRYAGTEGERDACNLISREFESLGCEVTREETEYIKSEKYLIMANALIPFLLLGLLISSWLVHPLTSAVLIIALLALSERVLSKLALTLAKDKSINVIATTNPEKQERLILCGHYDSAQVFSKFAQEVLKIFRKVMPFLMLSAFAYIGILFVRGVYLLVIQEFSLVSLIELSPRIGGVWTVIWLLYILIAGFATLFFTYAFTSSLFMKSFSYGADDNASGIAVMRETARRLQNKDLNLRIDFACFAAEEKGLFGSRKWVNKHLKELDKNHTYVLNLDCVGRGEKFFLNRGLGDIFKKHSDPMLCNLISEACSELEMPLEEAWGGGSDHAEFVSKKFRTCAIMRANPENAGIARLILRRIFGIPLRNNIIGVADWIHTEDDTVNNIDEQKLDETVQLVVKFVEKLDQAVEQYKWQSKN